MFLISKRVFVFVVHLIIFLNEAAPEIQRNRKPANEFTRPAYTTVQPSLYHGRTKREIYSTNGPEGEHHQRVAVELNVDNETLVLDLVLKKDLLTHNYVVSYQQDGKTKKYRPSQKELDICQYNGEVRGKPGSWAAISTCHGLRGVFHDGKKLRYIEPEGTTVKSLHFIYNHSNHFGNGTEMLQAEDRSKRDSPNESDQKMKYDGAPKAVYNGNEQTYYIELVVVVDNSLYKRKPEIEQEVIDLVNVVNSMMAPLNIFVTLVGVKIWRESDEIIINKSSRETLAAFLEYRFEKLLLEMPNDHATLLTDQSFDGSTPTTGVVGTTRFKAMCTREQSGSIVSWDTELLGEVASTMAHEIGHSLGIDHDPENCQCKEEACLMAPMALPKFYPTLWSDCSLNSLPFILQKGEQLCLRNKPRMLEPPICGNGFIESGEQCDCGVGPGRREGCEACCHSDTCQLRSNASCATGSCCNLQTCQIKPGATLCREAMGECDLPEYCTGESAFCPVDVHKIDTTPCKNNKAYCVRGNCRTHNSQCRLLWGKSGSNGHNICYSELPKDFTLRCGYDFLKKTYLPCKEEDVLCGRLQCANPADGGNNELGEMAINIKRYTIGVTDETTDTTVKHRCRLAVIDTGTDEDLGMVPDGAVCGKGKMCMNHQCLDVTDVRKRMKIKNSVCPSNCSGHGVCDSKGNCHCDAGYQPPLCKPKKKNHQEILKSLGR